MAEDIVKQSLVVEVTVDDSKLNPALKSAEAKINAVKHSIEKPIQLGIYKNKTPIINKPMQDYIKNSKHTASLIQKGYNVELANNGKKFAQTMSGLSALNENNLDRYYTSLIAKADKGEKLLLRKLYKINKDKEAATQHLGIKELGNLSPYGLSVATHITDVEDRIRNQRKTKDTVIQNIAKTKAISKDEVGRKAAHNRVSILSTDDVPTTTKDTLKYYKHLELNKNRRTSVLNSWQQTEKTNSIVTARPIYKEKDTSKYNKRLEQMENARLKAATYQQKAIDKQNLVEAKAIKDAQKNQDKLDAINKKNLLLANKEVEARKKEIEKIDRSKTAKEDKEYKIAQSELVKAEKKKQIAENIALKNIEKQNQLNERKFVLNNKEQQLQADMLMFHLRHKEKLMDSSGTNREELERRLSLKKQEQMRVLQSQGVLNLEEQKQQKSIIIENAKEISKLEREIRVEKSKEIKLEKERNKTKAQLAKLENNRLITDKKQSVLLSKKSKNKEYIGESANIKKARVDSWMESAKIKANGLYGVNSKDDGHESLKSTILGGYRTFGLTLGVAMMFQAAVTQFVTAVFSFADTMAKVATGLHKTAAYKSTVSPELSQGFDESVNRYRELTGLDVGTISGILAESFSQFEGSGVKLNKEKMIQIVENAHALSYVTTKDYTPQEALSKSAGLVAGNISGREAGIDAYKRGKNVSESMNKLTKTLKDMPLYESAFREKTQEYYITRARSAPMQLLSNIQRNAPEVGMKGAVSMANLAEDTTKNTKFWARIMLDFNTIFEKLNVNGQFTLFVEKIMNIIVYIANILADVWVIIAPIVNTTLQAIEDGLGYLSLAFDDLAAFFNRIYKLIGIGSPMNTDAARIAESEKNNKIRTDSRNTEFDFPISDNRKPSNATDESIQQRMKNRNERSVNSVTNIYGNVINNSSGATTSQLSFGAI